MKKIINSLFFFTLFFSFSFAQSIDTLKIKNLEAVQVKAYRADIQEIKQLSPVAQSYITAGKKNEVIQVQDLPANLSEKTGRQIFAKIPGAFIYDMDGSGNQVNISTRGLDPHRSWENNIRVNGVMSNSDLYGYPASHFSLPMEAIQRIEIIRGTAALQYGAQFGGLINYVTKSPDTTRQFSYENLNTVGSFGLMSTYNAVGGRIGKLTYAAYYQRRVSNGYRDNAKSDAQSQFVSLNYAFSSKLNLRAELGRSQYRYQIPGPLTDSMFNQNPRQSTRSRNYFSPDIYLPSLTLNWQINSNTQLNFSNSAVLGSRNSIQFVGFADSKDKIDPVTLQYKSRQIDIDHFNTYASEIRLQHNYALAKIKNTLIAGIRLNNNDLHRQQLGKGTTGSDYNLALIDPNWGRDIHFKTQNLAIFIENLWKLTSKFSISTGARLESGTSKMSGKITYLADERIPLEIPHRFPLFGVSSEYKINQQNSIYGGFSQAFRPVIFADIIPPTVLDKTDPNIKDAFGHNAEIGVRGKIKQRLTYDVSFFQILYKNRIGTLILNDDKGAAYYWKTNIGDSRTNGLELYLEYYAFKNAVASISAFTATSYFDARYLNGSIRDGNLNKNLKNKYLEGVPTWTSRNGLQISYKTFSSILQYSYVGKSYADPLNTELPTPNGAKGLVPAYGIFDWNMAYRFSKRYVLRFGINNLTNQQYFTKRPTTYPGGGVWSSDGRSIVVSLGMKL
jgi:Fe(3+) dicitrate transport protein